MNTQDPYGQFGQFEQYGQSGQSEQGSIHETAGAYVLGILDDAEATAFEAHLAGCDICAAHLEEFAGMEPMLAMLAESPGGRQAPPPAADLPYTSTLMEPPPRPAAAVPTPPGPQMLDRLVGEVAVKRARKRQRSMYMIAASVVLIFGGPAVAVVVTNDDASAGVAAPHPTSPAEDAFFNHMQEKVQATDATTRVSATVGMEKKPYGTHAVLELKNVKGPLKCGLYAVSRTGEEAAMGSWNVPKWGYGIADSPNETARKPLYVHGGVGMDRNEIDHFEVRTVDGKLLVEIDA